MKIVVGITGASGAIYGWRLLEVLKVAGVETHVVASEYGLQVLRHECGVDKAALLARADKLYAIHDMFAPIASGSCLMDAMVIVPCSMRTLGSLAGGIPDNLLTRAADVSLKENRLLVIVPRETPLTTIHIANMLTLAQAGAKILPASPGFYHRPADIQGLVDILVGKICDMLRVQHDLFKRWAGE